MKKFKIATNLSALLVMDIALIFGFYCLYKNFELSVLVVMIATFGIGIKIVGETARLIKDNSTKNDGFETYGFEEEYCENCGLHITECECSGCVGCCEDCENCSGSCGCNDK